MRRIANVWPKQLLRNRRQVRQAIMSLQQPVAVNVQPVWQLNRAIQKSFIDLKQGLTRFLACLQTRRLAAAKCVCKSITGLAKGSFMKNNA